MNTAQELLEERIRALDHSSSKFDTLFENSPVSIQVISLDGRTIRVNAAFKALWDINDEFVEQFIFKEYNILTDPILVARGIIPHLNRAWAGEFVELPSFFYDPSEEGFKGRKRITRPLVCPVKNNQGEVVEIILLHQDITDQHEIVENKNFLAELAAVLLGSLDYNTTLEHIALATIPFFSDGCMVDILEDGTIKRLSTKHRDPEIEEILIKVQKGYPPTINSPQPTARVIRSGKPELLPKVDLDIVVKHTYNQEHADLIRSAGLNSHLAIPLKIRGETVGAINFWINSSRRPFDEQDLQLGEEISRYASLAIDNARLYRDAQQAISQREDFISIASHELKTPVTALMLQIEMIQSILTDRGPVDRSTLDKISAGTGRQLDRLKSLIDDMLDLTRISSRKLMTELSDIDLKELIKLAITSFSEQLKNHEIKLTFKSEISAMVNCDPSRVQQVITNLISNAILYGDNKPIEIKLEIINEKAVVKVKDHGIGIDPSDHARIFKRFERGTAGIDGRGLGLGLFISQQIMNEQNGRIWVESTLGQGSTFIFELPLS